MGGGFGGLNAARGLAVSPVEVIVVDRRNHHLFQPLLYQVATAGLNAADIAAPIRRILRGQRNLTVLMAEVTDIDVEGRIGPARKARIGTDTRWNFRASWLQPLGDQIVTVNARCDGGSEAVINRR